jgi:hypothetical protein
MKDWNALIGAAAAAEADLLINGPDGGRREALEQAEADLWWARVAERFAGWTVNPSATALVTWAAADA